MNWLHFYLALGVSACSHDKTSCHNTNNTDWNIQRACGNIPCHLSAVGYGLPKSSCFRQKFIILATIIQVQTLIKTRPDTRLPQSRASGQGLYFRSLNDLGRSSDVKNRKKKKPKKVKCDGRTDQRTNGPTDRQSGL